MTWNVYGLKRKLSDSDFSDITNNYDIILFGETWLNNQSNLNYDINGFECDHVFGSKSKGNSKGRYSGGVSLYYKPWLKKHLRVIEKSKYGYIWIKLDKNVFTHNEDVYICYMYVRPNCF